MPIAARIAPCLWFDDQAEAAANFYVGIFKNARITNTTHYGEAGKEIHGKPAGSVLTVSFELDGMEFTALNGGPIFKITEAVSFQVMCEDQAEIDYYWDRLGQGGDPAAQRCGWLKDQFGVSWQVVPRILPELLHGPDPAKRQRAMAALFTMQKLEIAKLKDA
ncbi:MAG: VOC family protein [Planctomycetota bacterium]|nr:VOC family protein [Planctomycetota bacterium]